MASSAKETNGTFKGPISYKLSKKSWTEVITGGSLRNSSVMSEAPTSQPTDEPDHLTSSAASPSLDHFTGKVTRSYLTGTVPHSIIIDITNVLVDKKKTFIVDLATFCEGNTHLWAVSKQIRKENNRSFAEISVSPSMYQKFFQSPTLKLENFDAFHGISVSFFAFR